MEYQTTKEKFISAVLQFMNINGVIDENDGDFDTLKNIFETKLNHLEEEQGVMYELDKNKDGLWYIKRTYYDGVGVGNLVQYTFVRKE